MIKNGTDDEHDLNNNSEKNISQETVSQKRLINNKKYCLGRKY